MKLKPPCPPGSEHPYFLPQEDFLPPWCYPKFIPLSPKNVLHI